MGRWVNGWRGGWDREGCLSRSPRDRHPSVKLTLNKIPLGSTGASLFLSQILSWFYLFIHSFILSFINVLASCED